MESRTKQCHITNMRVNAVISIPLQCIYSVGIDSSLVFTACLAESVLRTLFFSVEAEQGCCEIGILQIYEPEVRQVTDRVFSFDSQLSTNSLPSSTWVLGCRPLL